MQNKGLKTVVLGTGGTIAGTSTEGSGPLRYTAAQLGVATLLQGLPGASTGELESEQVSQLDSKDMSHEVWRQLALRCDHHLARADVAGVVVTHGTDTLEESAWFLQRVLAPSKPIVLTAAMRPATALQSDGPQNLLDAVATARTAGARGVVTVLAGTIIAARDVRKAHPYRIDAFSAGDAGAVGVVEDGRVRAWRDWPQSEAIGIAALPAEVSRWPKVEIVASHAGASGAVVRALCAAGVDGIVVAATGNGRLHRELEAALLDALRGGVAVLRSTRCAEGRVLGDTGDALESADDLTPAKARVELLLRLLKRAAGTTGSA